MCKSVRRKQTGINKIEKQCEKGEVSMQQKTVSKYTKEQTCEFANEVLFRHYGSRATQIKYIGGGSFGYVYKAELPVVPYTLTVKACRVAGMQHNDIEHAKDTGDGELEKIYAYLQKGNDTNIKICMFDRDKPK